MTRRQRTEQGSAIIELALVLPILLMILVGIIQFGQAYNTQVSIQAAAREGARELALRKSSATVESSARAAAPSVAIDSVGQTPCPATGDGQAIVVVTEVFTFRIPFLSLGTRTLTAQAVMRCGL